MTDIKVLNDVSLGTYTTIKIGGIAKELYIPENKDELKEIVGKNPSKEIYIISGGSNLLINDERTFNKVILMDSMDLSMEHLEGGTFYCGASVRIQKFIRFAQEKGYGGIEYLYSLPALMGGIVFMNAGRGAKQNCCIGDHIEEVYALYKGQEVTLSKEQCEFAYRSSVFEKGGYIITGAKIRLDNKPSAEVENGIKERLELCKRIQDTSGTNFGSVFSECNARAMRICMLLDSQKKNGVKWSPKRGNWLINIGNGTFKQAFGRINRCKLLHRLMGKKCRVEVRVWE